MQTAFYQSTKCSPVSLTNDGKYQRIGEVPVKWQLDRVSSEFQGLDGLCQTDKDVHGGQGKPAQCVHGEHCRQMNHRQRLNSLFITSGILWGLHSDTNRKRMDGERANQITLVILNKTKKKESLWWNVPDCAQRIAVMMDMPSDMRKCIKQVII